MTTESKSIGSKLRSLRAFVLVEREVQVIVDVFVVITLFVVDGRRNNAILDGEDACNGFYRTGSAQQVAGHGFCRTDVQLIRMLSEYLFDCFCFRNITYGSRCTVNIDIIYFFGFHFCIFQRIQHH